MKVDTKQEKKTWTRPQLIVLGRGAPEEAVLAVCKSTTAESLGPSTKLCADAPTNCSDVASS